MDEVILLVLDNGRGFVFGVGAVYPDYAFLILLIDLVKGGSSVGPFIGTAFILNAVLAGDFTTLPSTQTKHVHS